MKFGCHAVLFADRIRTEPLSLLQELKETGFSGVEFGARFVPLEDRTAVMEAFQKTGLEIAAIHYMSLDWLSDPEKAIAGAVEEAKFLSAAGGKNSKETKGLVVWRRAWAICMTKLLGTVDQKNGFDASNYINIT